MFKDEYQSWYESEPDDWKRTIGGREPIFVTARWGQNFKMEVHNPEGLHGAQDQWIGDRDIRHARLITIALATDIKYVDDMLFLRFANICSRRFIQRHRAR